uniref:alpha-N-acetylgalactosaminide alpha-2,6-sialyltransferase 5-like n=1 Tax=Styela clava TaxID=7725 RepID=UPI00193ACB31|nr:alpha-N-acetylgalactosaminide alpha-2,6-sialyltransferase 5-like [Styela clava]
MLEIHPKFSLKGKERWRTSKRNIKWYILLAIVVFIFFWTFVKMRKLEWSPSIQNSVSVKYGGYENIRGSSPLKLRCTTCALVTNSGHTIGSYLGRQIDQTDCVFRLNRAPVTDYDDDVGSKTTIRVVSMRNLNATLSNESLRKSLGDVVIVYSRHKKSEHAVAQNKVRRLISENNIEASIFMITDETLKIIDGTFRDHVYLGSNKAITTKNLPTTGFTAFTTAMEICQNRLDIYGMVPPYHCLKYMNTYDAPYSYFPPGNQIPGCKRENSYGKRYASSHIFTEEAIAIRDLTQDCSEVRFFSPDWKKN